MDHFEFHELAGAYPLMPEADLDELAERMKEDGYDHRFPIVLLSGKILDGRNRYLAAQKAGIEPRFINLKSDEDPQRFVERANEHRRHLAIEWLQKNRMERVARSATAHVNGKSIRTIAKDEGVSQSQTRRDLEISGAPGGAPEPPTGKVQGTDGKTYSSRKNKPPVLCDRCVRVGPTPECEKCQELKAATKPRSSKKKPSEPPAEEEKGDAWEPPDAQMLLDALGHPVTPVSTEAFGNITKFIELDKLVQKLQAGIHELALLPGGEQLRRFLQATGAEGKVRHRSEHLNALKRDLKFTRPHAVCPYCFGGNTKACKPCNGLGWVSEVTWKDAEDGVKARVN